MSGLGIAAVVILGSAGVLLLVAMFLRIRERSRHHYSKAELQDLSRDDIDPLWRERDQASLEGPPPPSWDPCVTKRPHRPEDPPQQGSTQ
jgi:hypothetical protein